MNLIDFTKRLSELIGERPDLAERDMIVRNVQGNESGTDEPEEENRNAPYWLGSVGRIHIDRYVSTEDGVWFQADHDDWDAEDMRELIFDVQLSIMYEGDGRSPDDLPDDEVALMFRSLPWQEAIVVDIGLA